ncbi:phosphate/phosphite/phosphonate ABC transporter substrate-binding protein [Cyanobium sp. ATX 6F1]|uniref:phosphate/phosphite/phosphonate ABC transporter substrate-binding protein n=1 Tax=unclassified Cyanobium TaxID=2627006 RepID=UPI0020CFAF9F|nr:PhnD/SsuA/transferrin family substrate-binding protein [Cyanobium sp. ATX 6F1]MCP9916430.1 PhnD/SsuA/transferrin family substrate-binding protein [Cyanobium sp. ATX 6F1]
MPSRSVRNTVTAVAVLIGLFLAGCSGQPGAGPPFCGASGELRVGVVGVIEGAADAKEGLLDQAQAFELKDQLTAASRCEVQMEPVRSPDLARSRLSAQAWDLAFLPPGLMAFALELKPPYVPIRTLGTTRESRSSIVVPQQGEIRSRVQLKGARLGLLPRGSLTGFYLPLYNLHGLQLSEVVYALDYSSLLQMLASGRVDAIAWDEARPEPTPPVRRIVTDTHAIPMGSMVVKQELTSGSLAGLLAILDDSARDFPSGLGYVPGTPSPEGQRVQELRAIVTHVESWQLPEEGKPYRVFGPIGARR